MSTRPTTTPPGSPSDAPLDAEAAEGQVKGGSPAQEDGPATPEGDPAEETATGTTPAGPSRRLRAIPWRRIAPFGASLLVLLVAGLGYYLWQSSHRITIDNANLSAPQTTLPAHTGGILRQVYASVGDQVLADRPIARVGSEVITSDRPGTVISIRQDLGAFLPAGTTVATLIDRASLRVDGEIEEDKGLSELHIGQRAEVKFDAFGGRKFPGVVEEISDQPRQGQIAFSISDKRESRKYQVTVRLDGAPDAELKQGMSARITVFK